MMIKGYDPSNVKCGNSFTRDGFAGQRFDYFLANPPYGVEWKKVEAFIRNEHEKLGYEGRFGAGLPRINDGSFLFLQHMISKWKPAEQGGSRLAIVLNGSPLFTGGPGSGESEIRRWIIENDWLEAIVALPDQLFYNTGINTYVWVLTNRKSPRRRGKVQLVNAVSFYQKMRKSLGNKRNEIGREQIDEIVRSYGDFAEGPYCKIFDNEDFGYRRITVERPLRLRYELTEVNLAAILENKAVQKFLTPSAGNMRLEGMGDGEGMHTDLVAALRAAVSTPTTDATALAKALDRTLVHVGLNPPPVVRKALVEGLAVCDQSAPVMTDKKGHPLPDPELRDSEDVPLKEDVDAFFEREVKPHVPDAWINRSAVDPKDGQVGKVGYEINFNRYFYRYQPPRPLEEIEAEIKVLEQEIVQMLREVTA
jgi:type I restriction enzyme M protein